ncbi:MAG: hypothetical protein ACYCZW_00620 [Minisyncoccota bacterium]
MKNTIIVVVVLLLISIGIYTISNKSDIKTIGCTEEALMCPDGSFSVREGDMCLFRSCPTMDYVEGILEQKNGEFRLLLDSPIKEGGEVSYIMPLNIKISNVLGQLVNKKVKAYGVFKQGNTLLVDHLEELPKGENDRTIGSVKLGQTVFINGVRITLNKIIQDSRCPVDVTCIRAGDVTVSITLKSNTDSLTKDINSADKPFRFDSFMISIEDIKPETNSKKEIKTEEYGIKFKVVSN